MRLITWNCQQGFEKKRIALLSEQPDVAIIQECSRKSLKSLPSGYHGDWLTGPESKGLAVILQGSLQIKDVEVAQGLTYFAKMSVVGTSTFQLIACWNTRQAGMSYPEQLHRLLDEHSGWFAHSSVVLAGDLNSQLGTSFDSGKRRHKQFEERLREHGLVSSYSAVRGISDLIPPEPTHRFLRKQDRPFHIDYIYVPNDWIRSVKTVAVGAPVFWSSLSDHAPVILSLA